MEFNMPINAWFTFIVFAFMTKSSLALNCYICDSSLNTKCADLTHIEPKPCQFNELDIPGANLSTSNEVLGKLVAKVDVNGVECRKIVLVPANVSDSTNKKRVVRECHFKIANESDTCELSNSKKLFLPSSYKVESCDGCDLDSCNTAAMISSRWLWLWIFMSTIYSLFKF